ncbi:hypothetical protein EVA_20387 [gut metagenome]|uniref:Uncharacterized protein n=1 Tax=gut metagenome TaxID=749906 RepID=J9FAQ5_9ZZZZ
MEGIGICRSDGYCQSPSDRTEKLLVPTLRERTAAIALNGKWSSVVNEWLSVFPLVGFSF